MADGPGAAAEDGRETPQGQHEQEGGPAVEDAGGDSGIVLREDIDSRREPEMVQKPQPKQRQVHDSLLRCTLACVKSSQV